MLDLIFREYDIRGLYPSELNEKSVKAIGYALGLEMKAKGCEKVSIGYDARYSANELFNYLISGLNKANMQVFNIGLAPTPMGYFSLFFDEIFDANIMITGSHNPKEYNGFKITISKESFFGADLKKLSLKVQEYLELEIKDDLRYENYDVKSLYIDFLVKHFTHLKNYKEKIIIDCANGATGVIIKPLVEKLGLNAQILFEEPDGNFPNHAPDPTELENLHALQVALKENENAKMGFAFDGDGDRLVVASKDYVFKGDELCYLFAKNIKNPRVLGEVKCSKNLFDEVAKFGFVMMGKTGHSNIKKTMKEQNIDIAAELSGHIFFKDRYFGYDDGIYAFLRTLELLVNGFDIEKLVKELPKLYASEEIKLKVSEENKFQIIEKFKEKVKANAFENVLDCNEIDGVRITFKDGWVLLRASNTSPYLIMRSEASTLEFKDFLEKRVRELFDTILTEI
ncbi:phosphomannomutase/phosphoglucomutase [Campylobacter peloridis]|uniref:phosphomannomutase/phosphoglucomutase n=1 Tax=Campylobacter peloridis TaxID=488546 RepID=UPI001C733894|nr:phosphomannomutase/phosphoglucomutase [Campylobacter peloridis]MBX2078247.1 phosphomannomutase/phosphoglucomutase [Campylobacter peloridis]